MGLPSEILTDNAPEFVEWEWRNLCLKYYVKQRFTEPHTPWQNPAKLEGGIVKRNLCTLMKLTNTPACLWDCAWQYVAELRSFTTMKRMYLDRSTPFEEVCGYTPEISEFILFSWYKFVWYFMTQNSQQNQLGRWLGPAIKLGQGHAYIVLTANAKVIVQSTVTSLSTAENFYPAIITEMQTFDDSIDKLIRNTSQSIIGSISQLELGTNIYNNMFDATFYDNEDLYQQYNKYDEDGNYIEINDLDELTPNKLSIEDLHDNFKGKQVKIPHEGETKTGFIIGRKRNADGSLVGLSSPNPKDDHSVYEVQFDDSIYSEYAANVILENTEEQIDRLTSNNSIVKGIIGHQKDDKIAVHKKDSWILNKGTRKRIVISRGWDIETELTDGTTF